MQTIQAAPAEQRLRAEPITVPGDVPRPEHPRPDLEREHWLNLNGRWRFSFDPQNAGEQQRWYHVPHPAVAARTGESSPVEDPFGSEIVVPFPWESRLSGVFEPRYKGVAWYQRTIEVPADWAQHPAEPAAQRDGSASRDGKAGGGANGERIAGRALSWRLRPYLCFGAVDWSAKVWINGRFATEHDGGYTPFTVDLSDHVRPGSLATLTVRVVDHGDADQPLGKQTDDWYTHTSGIWQTVWLEGRPAAHLEGLRITPNLEAGTATFIATVRATASLDGASCRVAVESLDGAFGPVEQTVDLQGRWAAAELTVAVPEPRAWSPEDPHLYECVVTVALLPGPTTADGGRKTKDESGAVGGDSSSVLRPSSFVQDRVRTYFGLRSVSTGHWEDKPYEYVFLNGKPIYLRGVLDQAFHPDAIYAYPSDEAIRGDVQAAKDLGLNMLRCHIKVNDPRYYYWADRLGMLVMYDFPSASIYTPKARTNWEQTFRAALERDFSHPSIFSWILFNETWGLEEHRTPASWQWVKDMYYLAKQLDATRIVEDNSTYLWDHVTTDINTWHFYVGDYERARRHVESVVSQTYEGSPFHYVSSVYGDNPEADSYRQGTQPLLNSEYAGISAWGGDRDISYSFKFLTSELRRHDMICGYVYTELTDVEWEHNGLLNYDRTPKEFGYEAFLPAMTVADLNGADHIGLDGPPCQTLRPGTVFSAPLFVSHWDHRPLGAGRVRWRASAIDRFGDARPLCEGEHAVRARQYGVSEAGTIQVHLPDEICLVTVAFWLEDEQGRVRARNYVNVDVYSARGVQSVERRAGGCVLRFMPGDFLGCSWVDARVGPQGSKFGAAGAGWVDYGVNLPEDVDLSAVRRLRLRVEASARTAQNRIDWKNPLHLTGGDYPQTEQRKLPTEVTVWVNGVRLGRVDLPDDPADARGVLSLHPSDYWEPGSHGYLVNLEADEATTQRILGDAQGGRLLVRFEVPRGRAAGGINLYGARMGSFPLDPTIFLDF